MERIGDHAEQIAKNIIKMDHGIDETDQILEIGKLIHKIFRDAVKSLSENDTKHTNNIIKDARKAAEIGTSIDVKKIKKHISNHSKRSKINYRELASHL